MALYKHKIILLLSTNSSLFQHQGINDMKSLTNQQMLTVVKNLATYMDYVTMETSSPTWSNILTQFENFFRRLPLYLPNPCDMSPVLKVIITILKMPGLTAVKVRPTEATPGKMGD